MEEVNSIYIHIPFCKRICSYCDFCKVLYKDDWVKLYLDSLSKEINKSYKGEEVSTIYIGGGTPSSLSINNLKYLFEILKQINKTKLKEFTFECNIEDITEELLDILSINKINRISIGIESFNKDKLSLMHRNTNYIDTLNKINLLRKKGFNNINLDLIYALPNEDLNILKEDVKSFLSLNVEHISTYSLILEDNTYLKYKGYTNISDNLDYAMYKYICDTLVKNGYTHYEVSNFAKKGYESKHNLTYWNNESYYGFGLSASGYINNIRYTNTLSLKKYLYNEYVKDKEILTIDDTIYYEIILGLRKLKGIDTKVFYNKYHTNIESLYNIDTLIKENLLIKENNYLRIPKDKIYLMNEILVRLV